MGRGRQGDGILRCAQNDPRLVRAGAGTNKEEIATSGKVRPPRNDGSGHDGIDAPTIDDWTDESVWVKANPNLGVSKKCDDVS